MCIHVLYVQCAKSALAADPVKMFRYNKGRCVDMTENTYAFNMPDTSMGILTILVKVWPL